MHTDKDFGEVWANLYFEATRALVKMKAVYDEFHPDAGPEECWAEVEALNEALHDVEEVTGYAVRQ